MFHVEHWLQRRTRLVRLELVARLRRTGWIPAVILLGWVGAGLLQEPRFLRGYGIAVSQQGAWAAAALLLPLLLTPCRISSHIRHPDPWSDRIVSLMSVWMLGLAQAALVCCGEWLWFGAGSLSEAARSALIFGASWTPLALAACRRPAGLQGEAILAVGMLVGAALVGVAVGHSLWHDGVSGSAMAALLVASLSSAVGCRALPPQLPQSENSRCA